MSTKLEPETAYELEGFYIECTDGNLRIIAIKNGEEIKILPRSSNSVIISIDKRRRK